MKSLIDLEKHDCRFPFGENPFLFCGEVKRDDSSYCSKHHAICFRPVVELLRGRDNPHAGAVFRKMYSSATSILTNDGINGTDFAA